MALGNHYAGCAPATAEEAARVRTEKEAAYRQPKITDILLRSRLTDPDTVPNHSHTAVSKPSSSRRNPPPSPGPYPLANRFVPSESASISARTTSGCGKYYKPQDDRNAFFVIGRELPKRLQEGESHAEWGPFTAKLASDLENTRKIYVWAARGKEWALSKKQLQELKEEARKVIQSAQDL